jgi:hypothetical protein
MLHESASGNERPQPVREEMPGIYEVLAPKPAVGRSRTVMAPLDLVQLREIGLNRSSIVVVDEET